MVCKLKRGVAFRGTTGSGLSLSHSQTKWTGVSVGRYGSSAVVQTNTAGETPKRSASFLIWRVFSSRLPAIISDTTP